MGKARIMIAAEEPGCGGLRRQLEDLNYEVCAQAHPGEQPVACAERERPDLVLMDIFLPGGMDGIEAARQIRDRHKTPVVFLATTADGWVLERAKRAEPYGYLVKPLQAGQLHSTVELTLHKAKAETERQWLTGRLQNSLAELKKLSGFLAICSGCKKIRDEGGDWQQVEEFIQQHSDASLTHSICAECTERLYPELTDRGTEPK